MSIICAPRTFIAKRRGRCRFPMTACFPPTRRRGNCLTERGNCNAAPFERIQVKWENQMLDGYFRKPGGAGIPQGKKFPAVIAFQGADTMAEATIMGMAGAYLARGMAFMAVDFPGQGGALRLKDLHLPPETV